MVNVCVLFFLSFCLGDFFVFLPYLFSFLFLPSFFLLLNISFFFLFFPVFFRSSVSRFSLFLPYLVLFFVAVRCVTMLSPPPLFCHRFARSSASPTAPYGASTSGSRRPAQSRTACMARQRALSSSAGWVLVGIRRRNSGGVNAFQHRGLFWSTIRRCLAAPSPPRPYVLFKSVKKNLRTRVCVAMVPLSYLTYLHTRLCVCVSMFCVCVCVCVCVFEAGG